jgi:hypothetical protein
MSNYTRPDELDKDDSARDWLNNALIFASALGHILKENEGVIIDVFGDIDVKSRVDDDKWDGAKLIVYSNDNQMRVVPCYDDIMAGTLVWMDAK